LANKVRQTATANLCHYIHSPVGQNRSGWMKSKEGAHANHPMYIGVHGGEHPQS